MIITENYNEKLVRTYSDAGMKIERDGVQYDEAIDPKDSGRTYTETDIPVEIPDDEEETPTPDPDEATAEDYENALRKLGVDV